jgi:long-subunit fatty acid transport protein
VVNQDVKASLDMPANASLAISHQMDRWQFLGDYTWTGWSSVDTVRLKNKQTGSTDQYACPSISRIPIVSASALTTSTTTR